MCTAIRGCSARRRARSARASARQRTSVFARTRPVRVRSVSSATPEELADPENHDPPGDLDLDLAGFDHEQASTRLTHLDQAVTRRRLERRRVIASPIRASSSRPSNSGIAVSAPLVDRP